MVFTGYCFTNEPGSLSHQTHNFYKSFTNETIAEMQMRQITTERQNLKLGKLGIAPQDPLAHIPKLKAYY
jgi:ABC-type xylose transport system substrate-binding protein